MDYDLIFGFAETVVNPKPSITERDRALILSAFSFLEDRDIWERNSVELTDAEWDAVQALIGALTVELG